MARKGKTDSSGVKSELREDRLKAALKANLARRKAQNRARAGKSVEINNAPEEAGQDKDV